MKLSDDFLDQYDYAEDPLLRAALHAWDRMYVGAMLSYAPLTNFGWQMTAHQNRVAKDGARFLKHLGYSDRAAKNFRAAMLFHDIGKTHTSYNPLIWTLDDRPSDEEKALQRKHARLGAEMFTAMALKIPHMLDHPHYKIRHAVTLFHHERVDATGPERINVTKLPVFVQASCIIDAYDGDRIYRPHQERQRTKKETLDRLMGKHDVKRKYTGAFDKDLLSRYVEMKEKE